MSTLTATTHPAWCPLSGPHAQTSCRLVVGTVAAPGADLDLVVTVYVGEDGPAVGLDWHEPGFTSLLDGLELVGDEAAQLAALLARAHALIGEEVGR